MTTVYTIVLDTVLYLRQQTKLFINANRKNVIITNLKTLKSGTRIRDGDV